MKLSAHVDALLSDLQDVAAVGDGAAGVAAERLATALRSSASLRLLDAITEAAVEVSAQLPSGQVEVRLAGSDPTLVFSESPRDAEVPQGDDGLSARISLRLPPGLKSRIDDAAAADGLSVNAWLVRILAGALRADRSRRGAGHRLTGFASG